MSSESPRSETIARILEARTPMAEKAAQADAALFQIEGEIRRFKGFIPRFSGNLAPEVAASLRALDPAIDHLLARLSTEKGKISLLAQRFSRPTLNIGVAGRAGQGKSTLLQSLTGLTTHEIPTGDKGHCTGAPSIIQNHESQETYAVIRFHTVQGFLENVVAPFYQKLKLGAAPLSLDAFASSELPDTMEGATEKGFLEKLTNLKRRIPEYRHLLDGSKKRINREEIRSHVAQENTSGQKVATWIAVEQAIIYCPFPQKDVGKVALADTPGLGDFVSGAEERLAANVGSNLDAVLFVRRPPNARAVIEPADTDLYDLINGSIPELGIKDWSYFVINKSSDNQGQIDLFKGELKDKKIVTRAVYAVNCTDTEESLNFLDQMLNDIARNLGSLDQRLFELRMSSLGELKAEIQALAEQASNALPSVGLAQADDNLLDDKFEPLWKQLGTKLDRLVKLYRENYKEPDEEFLAAVESVFIKLNQGPDLPSLQEIESIPERELSNWSDERLHELRVNISNAFESIDTSLNGSFDELRRRAMAEICSEEGGRLGVLLTRAEDPWDAFSKAWDGYKGGEIVKRAIGLFASAGLSFRGFIQPRVRECLNVLDSSHPAANPYRHIGGDKAQDVKDKLSLAWEKACFNCRTEIEEMAKEPSMARFAAIEDFTDSIRRHGGLKSAENRWKRFYKENRADVWPEDFEKLEADTRLRKEWGNAVSALRSSLEQLPA
ncbi:MAG: GTPase domain-containing protein [Luteolibacter sp.]